MNRLLFLLLLPLLLFGGSLNTHITFNGEPSVSLRTITQAFNAIGYKLNITVLEIHNNFGELSAIAIGNRAFSTAGLGENLKEQGIQIEKATMDKGELFLALDTQNSVWNIPEIQEEEGIELKRVNTAQWYRVEKARAIHIQSPYAAKWYPDIAIFDRSMQLISSFRTTEPEEEFQLEIPKEAYYLKISNVQGMKILKEGMWIETLSPVQ